MDTSVADPMVDRLLDGRYRLDALVARGGMAAVYAATDTRLDRTVAVKVMRASLAEDHDFVERFAREARAAARLSSPYVVAVYDQGTDASDGTAYLVMELVDGATLREVLLDEGALPPARAVALLEPVLRALAAAHAAGLVHRDIKPENVLLARDGRVKVADFGLARAIETSSITATTGLLIGTVAYFAPEQVQQGRTDTRTDVYSAGILLYELLTGAPPYTADSPLSVAYRHVNDDVPAPSRSVPGLPSALDELVVRATRRDPAARPVDAGAFLAELLVAREDLADTGGADAVPRAVQATAHPTLVVDPADAAAPVTPTRRADPPRGGRRRLLLWALLAVLVLSGALVGGGLALTTTAPEVAGLTKDQASATLTEAGFTVELLPSQFDTDVPAQHIIEQDPAAGSRLRRGGVVALVNSKGPPVRDVPRLVGLPQEQATALLVKAGLALGRVTPAFDARPEGQVLSSDPAPGARLTPGSTVALTVSKGIELLPVPEVTGQSRADAEKALATAGFGVTATEAFSDTVAKGKVVSQDPASGSAGRGTEIALVVSKGPDTVAVPDVDGLSEQAAVAALKQAGLRAKTNVVLGFGPGQVLRSEPGRGKQVKRGSTVTIYLF